MGREIITGAVPRIAVDYNPGKIAESLATETFVGSNQTGPIVPHNGDDAEKRHF